jgi:diaminohydroxyphosphoribosylaminopyrimidine deaminase / 5-amino-6-(5-phosphoribosylamino)uracil reductase
MAFSSHDERFMQQALALAQRGFGKTSPNPVVGAVLMKNGRIISEGWHKKASGAHAEIFALRGVKARGATLYVTMEPCCTWGKTPPCTDAIIAAGVRRVVVAALDPNPKHNGRGLKVLRRAGIRVEAGLLASEATSMNEAFNKWVTTGMPLVMAKAAMSLDGKIATRTGDSKWITSEAARREAHKLRAGVDAVMVGANTVIRDDSQLTVRHGVRGRQPLRVVVDARGRTPIWAKIFKGVHRTRTPQAGTGSAGSLRAPVPSGTSERTSIVLTTSLSSARWRRRLMLLGVDVVVVKQNRSRVDLRAALRALGKRDVPSVLVEGGGELIGSFFDARLVDKVSLFYAPMVIGGRSAVTAVAGEGVMAVARAARLRDCRWRRVGKDEMLLEARVVR